MFRVFTTEEFDRQFKNLDKSESEAVRKILNKLREQGGSVGKPLRVSYFREKKFGGKRLYFLSYEDFMVVLAVAISNKKEQQKVIDRIISDIDSYKDLIIRKLKEI